MLRSILTQRTLQDKEIAWSKLAVWGLFLITLLLFFINRSWEYSPIIAWDVCSYYAYLPAIFVENDLSLNFIDQHPEYINTRYFPMPIPNEGYGIKTTMGMSILYLPYFAIGHLWASVHGGMEANGFSEPYHICIAFSGIMHAFIGIAVLRKVLIRYYSEIVTGTTLVLILLGTNALHYTYREGAMAHMHNFMLLSLFLRYTQLWFDKATWKRTIILGLLSGLIALVRPNNVVIGLAFIFFGVYSINSLKANIQLFWKEKAKLLTLLGVAFLCLVPQFLYWKWISGHYIYNSYGEEERFFFDRPRYLLCLFSYTKGWFIYTPIMIFAVIGMFMTGKYAKKFALAVPIFLIINTYIIFSWWSWWYGGGYSQRALIDSYPMMAFGMASFLTWVGSRKWSAYLSGFLLFLLLSLSLFQTWQYKMGLIRWSGMSKQYYWAVFLKMEQPENKEQYVKEPRNDYAQEGKVGFWTEKNDHLPAWLE